MSVVVMEPSIDLHGRPLDRRRLLGDADRMTASDCSGQ
jgi:hypothetical protein